jgi:hypothetical protein
MSEDTAGDFNSCELGGAMKEAGDWVHQGGIAREAAVTGASIPMQFEAWGREGDYDKDQMYAVYEPEELAAIIAVLTQSYQKVMFGS